MQCQDFSLFGHKSYIIIYMSHLPQINPNQQLLLYLGYKEPYYIIDDFSVIMGWSRIHLTIIKIKIQPNLYSCAKKCPASGLGQVSKGQPFLVYKLTWASPSQPFLAYRLTWASPSQPFLAYRLICTSPFWSIG